jgi:hypothetical protein
MKKIEEYNELDCVSSTEQIYNVPINTPGTIVYKRDDNNFMVEFFSGDKTIAVVPVFKNQIKKV